MDQLNEGKAILARLQASFVAHDQGVFEFARTQEEIGASRGRQSILAKDSGGAGRRSHVNQAMSAVAQETIHGLEEVRFARPRDATHAEEFIRGSADQFGCLSLILAKRVGESRLHQGQRGVEVLGRD